MNVAIGEAVRVTSTVRIEKVGRRRKPTEIKVSRRGIIADNNATVKTENKLISVVHDDLAPGPIRSAHSSYTGINC